MMRGRKVLRILAWILGVSSFLAVALLLSVYFILRSPSVQQKILLSIKEPLAEAGLHTEIEQLSIDLLGGVLLDGLVLKIERPPLAQGLVKLQRLRLRYGFWPLLQRRLVIRELLVEGMDGNLQLELPLS